MDTEQTASLELDDACIGAAGKKTKIATRQRILLAFDFDDTIVDENTDKYLIKLVPNQELPDEISDLFKQKTWIEFMNEVFKYLYKLGKTKEDILQCMAEIPFVTGMKDLLQLRRDNLDIDCIIISDSNSVFISHILNIANLSKTILQVFTNPATFDSGSPLNLTGYHFQEFCSLSSENLCKGHILKNFLQERKKSTSIEYFSIFYIGDGFNDLCPGLTLREKDFLMPRKGFTLESTIEKINEKNMPVDRSDLRAKVVPWSTGFDIIQHIDNWRQC